MRGKNFGIAMLASASFIWGTSLVAQNLGMNHVGPFTFNAVRFFVGGMSLLLVMSLSGFMRRKRKAATPASSPLRHGRNVLLAGGTCCGVALFFAASLQQVGILYTTVGKAGFITALYILFVPILGVILGRRLSKRIWGCVGMALTGMYLLCINESFSLNKGDMYILLCAAATAVHIMLIDHFSPLVDGVKLSCAQFFMCSFFSAALAVAFELPDLAAIFKGWASILYTGVLSCAVAYTFQTLGQKEVAPVLASLILSLEAVFAVLAAWAVLDELLTLKEVFGCILVFTAIVAVQSPGSLREAPFTNSPEL